MEYNLCCVGREAAAAVAETATTSKGQTKVDVEETKHERGKKGTRTDDDDDGVGGDLVLPQNIMDSPRPAGES